MFARSRIVRGTAARRGVVLVLILAMLALLALIGVSFAAFSGQAQVGSHHYAQAAAGPDGEQLMDYALSQLINGSNNPNSAIYGHDLKRDMYGNDAVNNGWLASLPGAGTPLRITQQTPSGNLIQCTTNIPVSLTAPYGIIFGPSATFPKAGRWYLKLAACAGFDPVGNPIGQITPPVMQTFEVLIDDVSGQFHVLTVSPTDAGTSIYNQVAAAQVPLAQPIDAAANQSLYAFYLDGRYLRAFNGPGMTSFAQYANFRLNGPILQGNNNAVGVGFPDAFAGMDEDYDAADLENWFLAVQSADGSIVLPSFHRPGILTAADWALPASGGALPTSLAKILRPRGQDNPVFSQFFPDPVPNPITGKIQYDLDSDGDGVTDTVWVDLGHPATTDASGRLVKPMFGFMVQGLNGRMPLNTVGNIQARSHVGATAGRPTHRHTSHLGTSPNEIDPKFALEAAVAPGYFQFDNSADPTNYPPNGSGNPTPGIPVSLTQLRNLLTGTRPADGDTINDNQDANYVLVAGNPYYLPNNVTDAADTSNPPVRSTAAVAGRFGEADQVPRVLPQPPPAFPPLFFNSKIRAGRSDYLLSQNGPSTANGATNIDPVDDENTTFDWGGSSGTNPEDSDLYDNSGSVLLPAERIRRFVKPIDLAGTGRVLTFASAFDPAHPQGLGPDSFGRVSHFLYFRPPGRPGLLTYDTSTRLTTVNPPTATSGPDITNNLTAGYESHRVPNNPAGAGSGPIALMSAMPYNSSDPTTAYPTMTAAPNINSNDNTSTPPVVNGYLGGSLGKDEAAEMNLYRPSRYDAPFGPQDLEWLYRKQDVDGASLDSRLGKLAPISFLNPLDGIVRRRMFSVDSWETTNFVWANDNPGNVFPNNHRFLPLQNASVHQAGVNLGNPLLPTQSLLHRDRKINLNFPLPVSNDSLEPVRQKWMHEAYQTLKLILPPAAVDSPQELAELGQFVVNIIDFRDPDGTITRFVNPDVHVTPATATSAATLHLPTLANGTADTNYNGATTLPLVQFGMEYNPIAINEVLAYAYNRLDPNQQAANPNLPTNRFFMELVNTLTRDGNGTPTTSDLNLAGWQVAILPDTDPTYRPDPITGQVPVLDTTGATNLTGNYTPVRLSDGKAVANNNKPPFAADNGVALPLPALTPTTPPANYYYVFANQSPDPNQETLGFAPTSQFTNNDLMRAFPTKPATGSTKYYWLYLLRPSNLLDPTVTSASTSMVVVDSFRFPYTEGGGVGSIDPQTKKPVVSTQPTNDIYSLERIQPFRGGQAFPSLASGNVSFPDFTPPTAYGYSEQTAPGNGITSFGYFGDKGQYANNKITRPIRHSLTKQNGTKENWDLFAFHDRDFQSVAELLLVPGCPPGLFTKQFVENPPDLSKYATPMGTGSSKYSYTQPPNVRPTGSYVGAPLQTRAHPFPYLVDNFFYTANDPSNNNPPDVPPANGWNNGGPDAAGWFKMMAFVEVPSPCAGAIGPVAGGQNFDWQRQDLKPGLLNINLIYDEEVFFGLLDDETRVNIAIANLTGSGVPQVVTQIDTTGSPTAFYRINDRGHFDPNLGGNPMKAVFSDFLKLRHGGSGYLFAFGSGAVGQGTAAGPNSTATVGPVAAERPFHDLSYPDINYTLMRPATLPPSQFTSPTASATSFDPGHKNTTLYASGSIQPPAVPARRLFQLADVTPASTSPPYASNAGELGDPTIDVSITHPALANPAADLAPNAAHLGADPASGNPDPNDRRETPHFRSEWLQKVTNLTTVRTHQYAVWVTVGFFEVVKPGKPEAFIPDTLGQEVGGAEGRAVRYRSFFIVDRSRATGFDRTNPGDFRDLVLYRRRIE